jgi:hypothetical protein
MSPPEQRIPRMTKFLIAFPGEAMMYPEALIGEDKAAWVSIFSGGIDEDVDPVLVVGDGTVTEETYPTHNVPDVVYDILKLPPREAAHERATKIAVACHCSQELRHFQYDPAS